MIEPSHVLLVFLHSSRDEMAVFVSELSLYGTWYLHDQFTDALLSSPPTNPPCLFSLCFSFMTPSFHQLVFG